MYVVYEVRGPTGFYIGKTKHLRSRWTTHLYCARRGHKTRLYDAMRKHGIETFSVRPILSSSTDEDALFCESVLIADYRSRGLSLYNMTEGGEGTSGWVPSAETRGKISASNTGRLLGFKHSSETRALLSSMRKGVPHSPSHNEAQRIAGLARGFRHTEESKRKISEGLARRRNRLAN